MTDLDDIDVNLLRILHHRPRVPIAELARLAHVARGTAQARLERMERGGVIVGYGPDVDPTAIGYHVLAFCTLQIAQGRGDAVVAALERIPNVLEVHAVTGTGDLLCRVAARSNDDLHRVLQRMLAAPGVQRTETHLALHTRLRRSESHLLLAE